MTLEFVAAPGLLDRAGIKPGAPLPERLAALKGAVVGVAAIGGAQEAAARWLAAKGGLDPKSDIKVAQVGNPVAIQAALENKRIDAFVLSPPEGYLAEKAGSGKILVSFGRDFPQLANQPYLVLAVKTPLDDAKSALIIKTARAMQTASAALREKPEETALAIQKQFFPKADPQAILTAIKSLSSGTADDGKLDAESVQNALVAGKDAGIDFGKELDARSSEEKLWTNRFVAAAKSR